MPVDATNWPAYAPAAGQASIAFWVRVQDPHGGQTWKPIFEHEATASIGDVAVAPSNPQIVYVGTGEPNNRQSSSIGGGVYKTTDGGATWGPVFNTVHNANIATGWSGEGGDRDGGDEDERPQRQVAAAQGERLQHAGQAEDVDAAVVGGRVVEPEGRLEQQR